MFLLLHTWCTIQWTSKILLLSIFLQCFDSFWTNKISEVEYGLSGRLVWDLCSQIIIILIFKGSHTVYFSSSFSVVSFSVVSIYKVYLTISMNRTNLLLTVNTSTWWKAELHLIKSEFCTRFHKQNWFLRVVTLLFLVLPHF